MQRTLKQIFGIEKLRLCQEGVLNAVMDGRDAICIMPVRGLPFLRCSCQAEIGCFRLEEAKACAFRLQLSSLKGVLWSFLP